MHRNTLFLFLTGSVFWSTGCGRQTNLKDYVPAQAAAQRALSAALDAWKSGKQPDQIGASNPAVNAQDTLWRDGKKLTDYQIVGPAQADDQNQWFTVKLTLAGEPAPKEATYVVLGKDPLWVMSADSYRQTSGATSGM